MTLEEKIAELVNVLDQMVPYMLNGVDPEWYKINAIRFVEKYAILRNLQSMLVSDVTGEVDE